MRWCRPRAGAARRRSHPRGVPRSGTAMRTRIGLLLKPAADRTARHRPHSLCLPEIARFFLPDPGHRGSSGPDCDGRTVRTPAVDVASTKGPAMASADQDAARSSPSAGGWVRWDPLPARSAVETGAAPAYQCCTVDGCPDPPIAAVHGLSRLTARAQWQPYCEQHAGQRGVAVVGGRLAWTSAPSAEQNPLAALPAELLLRLRPVAWATTQARHVVREFCIDRGMQALADDAALLTSELVTNAVRHAARQVTLHVALREAALIVTIIDDAEGALGGAPPSLPEPL